MKRAFYSVFFCFIFLSATVSSATPTYVRTAFATKAMTGINIAWTSFSDPEATVEYGIKPGVYDLKATGKTDTIDETLGTTSEVELRGLQPATTYYYRVGGDKGGFSDEYSFTTGPVEHQECGSLRFVYVGDSRSEKIFSGQGPAPLWSNVLQDVEPYKPAFLIHGGDYIYSGKESDLWVDYLKKTAPFSSRFPMMCSIGNHDDGPGEGDTANYNRIFSLPRSDKAMGGNDTEDYYYFTYGNAIFISLSTATFSGGTPKFKEQADWMDKVLTANPKRWKFVYLHHPIYTLKLLSIIKIGHPSNEVGQNEAFVPIFNKHHVDVVFQSHNHFYERWVPSACSQGGSEFVCPTPSTDTGTVYITSGGAGALTIPWAGPIDGERVAATHINHFINVDVENHEAKLSVIEVPSGKQVDSLTISKKLSGPDPCVTHAIDAGIPDAASIDFKQADATSVDQTIPDTTKPDSTQVPEPSAKSGCNCELNSDSKSSALIFPLFLLFALFFIHRRS